MDICIKQKKYFVEQDALVYIGVFGGDTSMRYASITWNCCKLTDRGKEVYNSLK